MLKPTICPVCNGLKQWQAACPACQGITEDFGRLGDYYGPYSPYRPINDIRMTNGYPDVQERKCLHCAYCSRCGNRFIAPVPETDAMDDI